MSVRPVAPACVAGAERPLIGSRSAAERLLLGMHADACVVRFGGVADGTTRRCVVARALPRCCNVLAARSWARPLSLCFTGAQIPEALLRS